MQAARALRPTPLVATRMVAAYERFSNDTLQNALGALAEVADSWIQGVDQAARLITLTADLDLYVGILETGDDDRIRDLATGTLRQISAMFVRDRAHGLIRIDDHECDVLSHPDLHEANA